MNVLTQITQVLEEGLVIRYHAELGHGLLPLVAVERSETCHAMLELFQLRSLLSVITYDVRHGDISQFMYHSSWSSTVSHQTLDMSLLDTRKR